MSEDLIVRCCAPTLAGIKTGSMFSIGFESKDQMTKELRQLNGVLSSCGICILPLRYHAKKALLYLFRPAMLQEDMKKCGVREILDEAGYADLRCGECIQRLVKRLREGDGFPHEIGLFLSYPPEDVKGFIENHAQNYKFIGYWKVYGDEEKGRKTFSRYRRCTDSYCKRLKNGQPLSELAVAI
jgi:hypothetical protein